MTTAPADSVVPTASMQGLHVGALALADRDALVTLHRTVFGSDVDAPWHAWKYIAGHGCGSGAWSDGSLVAHCGGIPRTLWITGRPMAGLQIGDVMVEPHWRGILTRRGPFFHASSHFYNTQIGAGRPFALGFGFPGDRHLRLAKMVGLLRDGGSMHTLHWHTEGAAALPPWAWRWEPLDPHSIGFAATVDQAWASMRGAAATMALGAREADYVRWRFVERPGRQHRFFILRRPWTRQPAGIAVLDVESAEAALWLDWIGPPGLMTLASRACRREATAHGRERLELWGTDAVAQALAHSDLAHQVELLRLGIVNTSVLDANTTTGLRWWLTGGDTDFL